MLFDIDVASRDGWIVVAVSGELDVSSAPRLRSMIVEAATAGGVNVVLDLSGVEFVDSTGLGVIVGSLKRLRGLGGDLRLAGGDQGVRRVFEMTGLDLVMPMHDSVDDAVSSDPVGTERDDG